MLHDCRKNYLAGNLAACPGLSVGIGWNSGCQPWSTALRRVCADVDGATELKRQMSDHFRHGSQQDQGAPRKVGEAALCWMWILTSGEAHPALLLPLNPSGLHLVRAMCNVLLLLR